MQKHVFQIFLIFIQLPAYFMIVLAVHTLSYWLAIALMPCILFTMYLSITSFCLLLHTLWHHSFYFSRIHLKPELGYCRFVWDIHVMLVFDDFVFRMKFVAFILVNVPMLRLLADERAHVFIFRLRSRTVFCRWHCDFVLYCYISFTIHLFS